MQYLLIDLYFWRERMRRLMRDAIKTSEVYCGSDVLEISLGRSLLTHGDCSTHVLVSDSPMPLRVAASREDERMKMNTRDIAQKLYAYADMLEGEKCRAHAMCRILNDDRDSESFTRLEQEVEEVRQMAAELWNKKEAI